MFGPVLERISGGSRPDGRAGRPEGETNRAGVGRTRTCRTTGGRGRNVQTGVSLLDGLGYPLDGWSDGPPSPPSAAPTARDCPGAGLRLGPFPLCETRPPPGAELQMCRRAPHAGLLCHPCPTFHAGEWGIGMATRAQLWGRWGMRGVALCRAGHRSTIWRWHFRFSILSRLWGRTVRCARAVPKVGGFPSPVATGPRVLTSAPPMRF